MRLNRLTTVILAAICCISLAGCTGMSLTGHDVLTPPMAHGAQSELQELIRESADGVCSLVHPAAGELQSAVISRDVDGDGYEEAVALYRAKDNLIHILSLSRDASGYAVAGEAALDTALIQQVELADLDNDGQEEFLAFYPDESTGLFSLTVIRLGGAFARADLPAACNRWMLDEFDGDPGKDLLLFSLSNAVGSAKAALTDYADGALSVKAACEMDSGLRDYLRITCGSITPSVRGVFVDGITASGDYSTQVVYYDPAAGLLNPLFIYAGYDSTRRFIRINSADIDGDGLIELPVCSLFDFEEKENLDTVCRRITWNNYDTDGLELITKRTAVLCDEEGCLFNISDNRVGAVTARHSGDSTVEIYAWEYRDGSMRRTDLLLTIRAYPKDGYSGPVTTEILLGSTDTKAYTCLIADTDHRLGYTADEVSDSLILPKASPTE